MLPMRDYGGLLLSMTFVIVAFAASSAGESSTTEFADIELYFTDEGAGEYYELSPIPPTDGKPEKWRCNENLSQSGNWYDLASWEMNMPASYVLGDEYSYAFWVESSNVQEIRFKTTLYILSADSDGNFSQFVISEDEVTKSAGFEGGQWVWLNENYTVELETSGLDKSDFPNGVPPYTTIGLELETSVTWAPDEDNRTVWIKAASPDFDSSLILNFRHVMFDTDYLGYTVNDRVDTLNSDSLRIKINVTNVLGVQNFDLESAEIEVKGIAEGGTFKDSISLENKHTFAKYIKGDWWYQEDQDIFSGTYFFVFSIKDNYGNLWRSQMSYDLVVDGYSLEIKFEEGQSKNGQVPKGGDVDYEFLVCNMANTRDQISVELDDSSIGTGWQASLKSDSTLDLAMGEEGYVRIKVEAPVSAQSASSVSVIIKSLSDSQVKETVMLQTTVRQYSVVFVSSPQEIEIDPEDLDMDGYYRFSINIRNTGSDKDTFKIDASFANNWAVSINLDGTKDITAVTIESSKTQTVDIIIKPLNFEDSLGEGVDLTITAASVPPGDGLATMKCLIVIDVPPEKYSDLSVSIEDVLINGKPWAALTEDDLYNSEPLQFQLVVRNNGGKETNSFFIKLYVGNIVIDQYEIQGGIEGFSKETATLVWEKPTIGFSTIKLYVDFDLSVDESNSRRSDNSLSLSVFVGEQASIPEQNEDSSLVGLNPFYTLFLLLTIAVFRKKRA